MSSGRELREMRVAILALTVGGRKLAEKLQQSLEESTHLKVEGGVVSTFARHWHQFDGFICIMASGIVVRAIADLLEDKTKDPCVVVVDQKGQFAISLLSGHLGGGNGLAEKVASISGGVAVITTASDTLELPALDLWVRDNNMFADTTTLTQLSSKLVNSGVLKVFSKVQVDTLPKGLLQVGSAEEADCIISWHRQDKILTFYPKVLVVGIGCNRGTPLEEFEEALQELFDQLKLSTHAIRNIASIDAKNDEAGLLAFAEKYNWHIDFYSKDEINVLTNLEISSAALKAVGAIGVAEPTALLSAQNTLLLSRKRKWQNITMAVAQASFTL